MPRKLRSQTEEHPPRGCCLKTRWNLVLCHTDPFATPTQLSINCRKKGDSQKLSNDRKQNLPLPEPRDDYDKRCLDALRRGEINLVHVFDPKGSCGFSYTVGRFVLRRQPELIVFGLPVENATRVLHAAGQILTDNTDSFDREYFGVASQVEPVVFLQIEFRFAKELLTYAAWTCGRKKFPVLQVVWRDNVGRYPFDPRYDVLNYRQRLLGSVPKSLFDNLQDRL